MTETALTHIKTDRYQGLVYANGEKAWVRDDRISSLPDKSTAIGWWSYQTTTKQLCVQYRSSETYYYYEGVPYGVVIEMMFADSLGSFIAKNIKPHYSVIV